LRAELIVDEIKKQGATHIVGLPDNGARSLFEALWRDPDLDVVTVTREGEAFAIADRKSVV
jgi:sulfopyruvate decarboxylase TPP-binding subunit